MNATLPHLEQIASRVTTLYSRPTVAMEIVRLTESPRVDAAALKQCVAQDPALACKLLRVVNSSLYGLNRPVADLNQAIALVGIKPLKLLVLGFSLPSELFAEMAARELQWYWTNTLTRAVAARLLAEQLWYQSGDEAFTAGLLQDIGILVLMRELGEPYARFLTGVIDEKCHLAALEQDTMGFDHLQLSAAILKHWQLPQRLVDAIALPKRRARLASLPPADAELPQILHLAELLMQVVGQRRLHVLPELLELGKEYRGMTKSKLASLVEQLQPQVDQLAEVLSLELTEKRDYVQMLLEAHQRMAAFSEEVAMAASEGGDNEPYSELLAQTSELSGAVRSFLVRDMVSLDGDSQRSGSEQLIDRLASSEDFAEVQNFHEGTGTTALAIKLVTAAKRCRDCRHELSLLIAEPNVYDIHSDTNGEMAARQMRAAIDHACTGQRHNRSSLISLSDQRLAIVLSNCERRTALELAQHAITELARATASQPENGQIATTLSIGVATSSVVPKNFDPMQMIDSATRCLSAARACGISTVKSIEL